MRASTSRSVSERLQRGRLRNMTYHEATSSFTPSPGWYTISLHVIHKIGPGFPGRSLSVHSSSHVRKKYSICLEVNWYTTIFDRFLLERNISVNNTQHGNGLWHRRPVYLKPNENNQHILEPISIYERELMPGPISSRDSGNKKRKGRQERK